jgi:hypothetical protein
MGSFIIGALLGVGGILVGVAVYNHVICPPSTAVPNPLAAVPAPPSNPCSVTSGGYGYIAAGVGAAALVGYLTLGPSAVLGAGVGALGVGMAVGGIA